jgi:UMF1 family MFS transporter
LIDSDIEPMAQRSPARESRQPWPAIIGWVLFDPAAHPFFALVTTFVFAPYFAAFVAPDPNTGQALWGYATGAAGLVIALLSPALGAIADAAGRRKPWIAAFSVLLVAGSAALWYTAPGAPASVAVALIAFAVGTIGAEFAIVFVNAMMPDLVPARQLGRLSGIAWASGYAGGLISLVIILGLMAGRPDTGRTIFGLAPVLGLDPATHEGDRAVGPYIAVWYSILALPLFLLTPDARRRLPLAMAVRIGLADLRKTLASVRAHANAARFLAANMVYTDGLNALFAFGGIYAAGTFGWRAVQLGLFGILILIAGIFGALAGGFLGDRLGPKWVIRLTLSVILASAIAILSIDVNHVLFVVRVASPAPDEGLFAAPGEKAYLALGALIGAAAGPLQASSRALMAQIAPRERMTEFFGLYALTGKATSFVAPTMVAVLTGLANSQRIGISVLLIFFAVGLRMMRSVNEASRQ